MVDRIHYFYISSIIGVSCLTFNLITICYFCFHEILHVDDEQSDNTELKTWN